MQTLSSRHPFVSVLPLALFACAGPSVYPGKDLAPAPVVTPELELADTARELEEYTPLTATPAAAAHLPVFLITMAGALDDDDKVDGRIVVIEEHDGTLLDLDSAPRAYEAPIGIELHGTSSSLHPKQGFQFECRDADGDDDDCALLGMAEGVDWVLHAPYVDTSYMRNALAYGFGRALADGTGRWEPDTRFVEVVLDGDYHGLYVLVERVSMDAGRLELPETTDPETGLATGGFIVKVDQHRGPGFTTIAGTPIDYVQPKAEDLTSAEFGHLTGWFNGFESTLFAEHFADPQGGYGQWIEVDAWVDHWLLNELSQNVDAYRLSAYLWSDGAPGVGKLRAGPLWDFDRAFGFADYCGGQNTEGWIADNMATCEWGSELPAWWARLREDPAFEARLRARWQVLRVGILADEAISARIATLEDETAEAGLRDRERWPVGDFGEELSGDPVSRLESWTLARAAWMDDALAE